MKKDKVFYGIIIFIIICFIAFTYSTIRLIKDNSECINNPFVYAAQKTKDQGLPVICRCSSLDPKYSGFMFTEYGIEIGEFNNRILNITIPD